MLQLLLRIMPPSHNFIRGRSLERRQAVSKRCRHTPSDWGIEFGGKKGDPRQRTRQGRRGETVTCAFIAILAILPRIGVALHESDQGLAGRTDDGPNDEDIKRATITINLLRGQRGESEMALGRVVDTN